MTKKKPQRFKLYFWKNHFKLRKEIKWKVDVKGKSFTASKVFVSVPTRTETRSKNPHAVITGKGIIRKFNGILTIRNK
jgi:hypothetical protein